MKPRRTPSDIAYERVRTIALGFPSTEEKLSHGAPSFFVGGKMFLSFVDSHHGDGRLAVWCKSTLGEQRKLVADNPARFFVPKYVGVKGWVGVHVDEATADWIELQILVEEAWRSVAPPRVLRGDAPVLARKLPPAAPRVQTDAKVARAALERLTQICTALPEVDVERESGHATFRVRKKTFAYFLDNHHGDGIVGACVRGDKRANAKLVKCDPGRYFSPAYVGPRGYLGVRLEKAHVDWKEVADRVRASYLAVAPKALVAVVR